MTIQVTGDEILERVRQLLGAHRLEHFRVRAYGQDVLVEPVTTQRRRDPEAVARLTALGSDAFGLAFWKPEGGFGPVLVVDTLEAIVANVIESCGPTPAEQPSSALPDPRAEPGRVRT